MGVYQFAIEFEQENRKFYQECAKNTTSKHLEEIFLDLAAKEKEHEEIVRKLADGGVSGIDEDIMNRAKDVFADMAKDLDLAEDEKLVPQEQVDIYKKANELEKRSYEFYEQKASETEDKKVKEILLKLAKEERKHEELVNNIVVMVDRPNTWLDDAEWNHMKEY